MTVVEIPVIESFVRKYYDKYFVHFMTVHNNSHSKSTYYASFSTNIENAEFL